MYTSRYTCIPGYTWVHIKESHVKKEPETWSMNIFSPHFPKVLLDIDELVPGSPRCGSSSLSSCMAMVLARCRLHGTSGWVLGGECRRQILKCEVNIGKHGYSHIQQSTATVTLWMHDCCYFVLGCIGFTARDANLVATLRFISFPCVLAASTFQ